MSAAFFNRLADPTMAHAYSAGTNSGKMVHPAVVEVMKEVGCFALVNLYLHRKQLVGLARNCA
jgi:protein-tyrosine-phosphatase